MKIYCTLVKRTPYQAFIVFFSFIILLTPFGVFAADPTASLEGTGPGLVPQCEGAFCRACDLTILANNVINFGIAFSVVVATLMFAYAGILYVTAAGKGAEQVKKAHGIFVNVFVGLVIVLIAWLLVDIGFSVLTGRGLAFWSKISCIDSPSTAAFSDAPPDTGGAGSWGTFDAGGAYIPTGGRCNVVPTGSCSPENLTKYFGAAAASNMSTICHVESGGNPAAAGDIGWYTKKPFSFGLFQINITGHTVSCPDGRTLNCPNAFGKPANPTEVRYITVAGVRTRIRAEAGWGRPIVDQALYNQCATAAKDPACNLYTAQKTFQSGTGSYGSYQAWAPDVRACGLN